jgi:hypothetical protein
LKVVGLPHNQKVLHLELAYQGAGVQETGMSKLFECGEKHMNLFGECV